MDILAILSRAPLFKVLDQKELESILEIIQYQIISYNKNYLIFQAEDKVDKLIVLVEGKVVAKMLSPSGKVLKVEDIRAPHTLGTAFLYGSKQKLPVYVTAVTNCKILYISKFDFQQALMKSEKLLVNYINIISDRTQFLSDKIKLLSFSTIRQKIAHLLLDKMEKENVSFHVGLSQTAMAELLGVARPSLVRCLLEMENDGLLRFERSYFTILDLNRMKCEME